MEENGVSTRRKVLCLHGYYQSGPIFEEKLTTFQKGLKKYKLEFGSNELFMTAPHKITSEDSTKPNVFKWMDTVPPYVHGTDIHLTTKEYTGIDESFAFLIDLIQKKGPFEGIIAFSQGALLASILLALTHPPFEGEDPSTSKLYTPSSFQWAMLFAGFEAPAPKWKAIYKRIQDPVTPTRHVWGKKDSIVPEAPFQALAKIFPGSKVYVHDGGHVVPNNAAAKKVYYCFLDEVGRKV